MAGYGTFNEESLFALLLARHSFAGINHITSSLHISPYAYPPFIARVRRQLVRMPEMEGECDQSKINMTKIEIDLNDILADEDGPIENLQESIKRQVIEKLTATLSAGISKQVTEQIAIVIDSELTSAVKAQMPSIVSDLMEAEYTPVGRYGERGQTTTFRNEMVKKITEEMKYRKTTYSSDENVFTKAVDAAISENVTEFKKQFLGTVNAQFVLETMKFAVETLKSKLGIAEK